MRTNQFTTNTVGTGINGDITFSNSVGIGTAAPQTYLVVKGAASGTYTPLANFYQTHGTGIPYITIGAGDPVTANLGATIGYSTADNIGWLGIGGDGLGTGLHWKKGGNVGIGTTNPATVLQVVGIATATAFSAGSTNGISTTWTKLISGVATNRITVVGGIVVSNVPIAW